MSRVVLVGDSHLTDASSRQTQKLGPRLRRRGHDVLTLARGGRSTAAEVADVAPTHHADWFIYCFGTNDAAPWKQVDLARFARNYRDILGRQPGGDGMVLGPPPVGPESEARGRTQALMMIYSEVAREVASRSGAHFLPLIGLLDTWDLAKDGVHVNDLGYDKIERVVLGVFGARRG